MPDLLSVLPVLGPHIEAASLMGTSRAPTVTPGISLGTGAGTPSISGNNVAGRISFTTGTLSIVSGTVMTLAFADGFTYPNGCVATFSAGNDNFAAVSGSLYVETTKATVTLKTRLGLGLSTTYVGNYMIFGY